MGVFAFVATTLVFLGYSSAAPVVTPTLDECTTVPVTTVSKPTLPGSKSGHGTELPSYDSMNTFTPASFLAGAPAIALIIDASPYVEAENFSSGRPFPEGSGPVSLTTTDSAHAWSSWQPGGPISSVSPSKSKSFSHTILPSTTLV